MATETQTSAKLPALLRWVGWLFLAYGAFGLGELDLRAELTAATAVSAAASLLLLLAGWTLLRSWSIARLVVSVAALFSLGGGCYLLAAHRLSLNLVVFSLCLPLVALYAIHVRHRDRFRR